MYAQRIHNKLELKVSKTFDNRSMEMHWKVNNRFVLTVIDLFVVLHLMT